MTSWLQRHPNLIPRFHGNGFTQLYLNSSQRLHVWHSDLPPIPNNNATIHDHTWTMESQVLFGTVTHKTYEWLKGLGGAWDMHSIYQAVVRGREEGPIHSFLERGDLIETGEYRLSEGSYYRFPREQLHESHHFGLTATLMTKTKGPFDKLYPVLICPAGETPSNAFDPEHQPPVEKMWEVINKAWIAMDEIHRESLKQAVMRSSPMCCVVPR